MVLFCYIFAIFRLLGFAPLAGGFFVKKLLLHLWATVGF